jgi:xylan 1,4-beta-xylosidase
MWRLDSDHGNVIKTYDAMGRPPFPSRDQIVQLRAAGKASAPENRSLKGGKIAIDIPPQGLVVIKVQSHGAH